MLDTYRVTASSGIPCAQMTHDHSSYNDGLKYYELPRDKRKYRNKKVIFLVRDVKEVLVSYYFHVTKREGNSTKNISEFIRNDIYGIKKILTFYNIWNENMKVPQEFLLLRYEDMHKNPEEVLNKTMKFLGCNDVEEHIIRNAVDFASFNNMKKMRPVNINDDESYKVRRGIVGGYEYYLSEEDIKYIDQAIKEMECPFEEI